MFSKLDLINNILLASTTCKTLTLFNIKKTQVYVWRFSNYFVLGLQMINSNTFFITEYGLINCFSEKERYCQQ